MSEKIFIGVDIGSTNSKLAILNENRELLGLHSIATGFSSRDSFDKLLNFAKEKFSPSEFKVATTGYGRDSIDCDKKITEITCHCLGAVKIFNMQDVTLIDVGGQDTKIIDISSGRVADFLMNDKCSAGTGRFLQVMARAMGIELEQLFSLAEGVKNPNVKISSLCTVFAESEIISLIGQGASKDSIAYAIVQSIATKVASQVIKIAEFGNKPIVLTGGLSNCEFFIKLLSKELGKEIKSDPSGLYAGAIGAAISLIKASCEK